MAMGMTRRTFLLGTGGALVLSLGLLKCKKTGAPADRPAVPYAERVPDVRYRDFEDVYRNQWKWDSVAKGTHFVNCWYQRGCNWNVYVKDGLVWREEQSGTYEQIDPKIPDYNPRGCQKGACYSERMYDESRLRHPLKRVGERGAGQWKRVSWDEALNDIADKTIDAMISGDGPGSVIWDQGTAQTNGGAGVAMMRTSLVLDTPVLDVNTEIGDHRPGAAVTLGKMVYNCGSDSFRGLDRNERIQKAMVEALPKCATHNGASRAFSSVHTGTIGSFRDSMIQAGTAMRSRIGATLARA